MKLPRIYDKIIKEFGGNIQEREDGRIEWVCEHGVGHTIDVPNGKEKNKRYDYIHGCDGCCAVVFQFVTKEKVNKSDAFIL